uniref:Peptidase C1A papain C-terminal domain-containing protein n=1 Tax=Hucho hucho TaxID=62062 RepID=A0A4W5PB08_9TELE
MLLCHPCSTTRCLTWRSTTTDFIENKRRIDNHNEGNHKFTSMNNCIIVVFLQLLEVSISFEYVNILIILTPEGTCKFKTDLAAAFVKDVVNITRYDELGMLNAVARHNPVSLAYEVTSDFMHYHSGVHSSATTPQTVNHALLAVGYDEEKGTPYCRSGQFQYFLIESGKNICGLAACSSYPRPMP